MDIPQRTINAVGKRDESIRRWMNSSTAKASQKTDDTHFKITFDNGSMLLSAVSAGDIEEVNRLIDLDSDVNYSSADGLTALHQACIDESIELVEILIKAGANINARDNEGWTPLHAAASTTSLEVVSYLVNHGANLSAVNTDGELAVDLADEDYIKDFLMDSITANKINLNLARNFEHDLMLSDIKDWISKGSIREIRDPQGATALHVAASKSYMDIMGLLVDRLKMDVNIRDHDGWTPLHAAVYWKQMDAVAFLLDHNADYQAKTTIGLIPLDLADEDIIIKYKIMIRKKNVSSSYSKKSASDDSYEEASSPEVFPHSFKPLPSPILKKASASTPSAKPNIPIRTHPRPSLPTARADAASARTPQTTGNARGIAATGVKLPPKSTASSILPPKSTASSMLPPKSTASSILPPKSTASSILPPKSTASSILPPKSTPSSILPPKSTPSSILPPKSMTTVPSSILPPKSTPSSILPPKSMTTVPSSMLPPKSTPSSMLPPKSTPSSMLPPKSTPSSMLPPKSTPSSILPPKSTPSSILPPKTTPSSILPPNKTGVSLPPSSAGAARPPTSEIPKPTIGTTYSFKSLEEAINEVVKLNNMVTSYKQEISLLETQLGTLKKSSVSCSNSTATTTDKNYQNIMEENKRLLKENATLIKAMSTIQKLKSNP